ncbi:MAG: hypothetical protein EON60_13730 [Alphaproteobacteria bacterium]|nr:MAG: hypothetical protein EON60_13730 [Alphaproteobacteria bacterium]
MLWCCERDPVVHPLVQLLAWLGFYHQLTYRRLRTFEARGIVQRRKPNRGYNSCEAYVLTRKGQRYMRLHSHRYGYTSRAVDNDPGPMEPSMA